MPTAPAKIAKLSSENSVEIQGAIGVRPARSPGYPPGFFTGCKKREENPGLSNKELDAGRTTPYHRILRNLGPYKSGVDLPRIGKVIAKDFPQGGTMDFFPWLTQISQSTAPPGQPFSPQWLYVAMALMIPALIGAVLAGILKVVEKTFGIKLGGGSV